MTDKEGNESTTPALVCLLVVFVVSRHRSIRILLISLTRFSWDKSVPLAGSFFGEGSCVIDA